MERRGCFPTPLVRPLPVLLSQTGIRRTLAAGVESRHPFLTKGHQPLDIGCQATPTPRGHCRYTPGGRRRRRPPEVNIKFGHLHNWIPLAFEKKLIDLLRGANQCPFLGEVPRSFQHPSCLSLGALKGARSAQKALQPRLV